MAQIRLSNGELIQPSLAFYDEAISLQPIMDSDLPIPIDERFSKGTKLLVQNYPITEEIVNNMNLDDIIAMYEASSFLNMENTVNLLAEIIVKSFSNDLNIQKFKPYKYTIIEYLESLPSELQYLLDQKYFLSKYIFGSFTAYNKTTKNILITDVITNVLNVYDNDKHLIKTMSLPDDTNIRKFYFESCGLTNTNDIISVYEVMNNVNNINASRPIYYSRIKNGRTIIVSENGARYLTVLSDRDTIYIKDVVTSQDIYFFDHVPSVAVYESSTMNISVAFNGQSLYVSNMTVPINPIHYIYPGHQINIVNLLPNFNKIVFSRSENYIILISKSDTIVRIHIVDILYENKIISQVDFNTNDIYHYSKRIQDNNMYSKINYFAITDRYLYYSKKNENKYTIYKLFFDSNIPILDPQNATEVYSNDIIEHISNTDGYYLYSTNGERFYINQAGNKVTEEEHLRFVNNQSDIIKYTTTNNSRFSLISGIEEILLQEYDIYDTERIKIFKENESNTIQNDFIDYLEQVL